ncbi:hypothetical protein EOC93_28175 [Mesorhizobium sp. M6A.T.Ce.TU.002.03.1.1]|uniref:hypothetical protein n=1 Tax=Mesorhizobium sp. M6A.T.Ce.TU.002.03.1.1 TaxID=2496782 RepID=UPI000FC9BBA3|nr:hypothetical protein [Mesorhizobium sp. M6A.T.Ce.TU.002.03.1.1]RUU33674.1 hypothetical protein EOC93_28175 [Mesorhizobium sp. M6A.T.Ce.TU.002.03.1.1]
MADVGVASFVVKELNWSALFLLRPSAASATGWYAAKGAYVANNTVLGQEYYDVQIKVVDRQLTLAGARLAVLLGGLVERSAASTPAEAVVMPAARAAE